MNWRPGDVLIVRPKNSDEQINELFHIFQEHGFNFGPDTLVQLSEIDMGKNNKIYTNKQTNKEKPFRFSMSKHLFLKMYLKS